MPPSPFGFLGKMIIKRRPHKVTPNNPQPVITNRVNRRRPYKYLDTFDKSESNQAVPAVKVGLKQTPKIYRSEYDYYDDEDVRVVDNSEQQVTSLNYQSLDLLALLDLLVVAVTCISVVFLA